MSVRRPLERRARRPGRVAGLRPARRAATPWTPRCWPSSSAAWHELDADPERAGDRQHRQRRRVPDRPRRRAAGAGPRRAARAVAPHQAGRAAADRVAQRGVEAGDRRGQRRVRRRRAALRGRRRHRDRRRRTRPSSTRTCRSARSARTRRSRLVRKSPMEAITAHGARRPPRARSPPSGPTSSASCPRSSTRADAACATSGRRQLADGDGATQARWGALELGSPTPAAGAGAAHVGPPRPDRGPMTCRGRSRVATTST